MKLWLLKRRSDIPKPPGPPCFENPNDPWDPWFNTMDKLVVCAETEDRARAMADKVGRDENDSGLKPWLNAELSTCNVIGESTADGESIILQSINRA